MRKTVLAAVFCLVFLGATAASAWHFLQRRIALKEKAPSLVRINQPAEDFGFRSLDGALVHPSSRRGEGHLRGFMGNLVRPVCGGNANCAKAL
jgi:hypothetical protein